MAKKDYKLYSTKVLNIKTKEMGFVNFLWKNKFADGEVNFATCVDKNGKRYNVKLGNISCICDDLEK